MSADQTEHRFVLRRDDGFVRVEWNRGVTVSERDARELVQRLEEVNPDLCEPMVAILNSMVSLDAAALAILANDLNVSALAIVGPTAVDRTIAQYFREVHQPAFPTRYFPAAAAAIDWLRTPGHSN